MKSAISEILVLLAVAATATGQNHFVRSRISSSREAQRLLSPASGSLPPVTSTSPPGTGTPPPVETPVPTSQTTTQAGGTTNPVGGIITPPPVIQTMPPNAANQATGSSASLAPGQTIPPAQPSLVTTTGATSPPVPCSAVMTGATDAPKGKGKDENKRRALPENGGETSPSESDAPEESGTSAPGTGGIVAQSIGVGCGANNSGTTLQTSLLSASSGASKLSKMMALTFLSSALLMGAII